MRLISSSAGCKAAPARLLPNLAEATDPDSHCRSVLSRAIRPLHREIPSSRRAFDPRGSNWVMLASMGTAT